MSKIIAVNAGSSSLKFKLYEMPEERVVCSGIADRIGHEDGIFIIKKGSEKFEKICPLPDHSVAVQMLLDALIERGIVENLEEIKGIGNRIVQGGAYFSHSEELTPDVEAKIESLIPLAPLHNGAHLICFRAFKKVLPNVRHVAVFDTAFHQTMAPEDYMYACPYEYYTDYKVRRYGAHGTSHLYLSQEAKKYLEPGKSKIISCHIGSGSSLCAIENGKCVTTSMGLTPLAGVMMGTRTGDIDPSVMPYIAAQTGKDAAAIYDEFNHRSGLLGISGVSNDTRNIEAAVKEGNPRAILAAEMFARKIADYIGQYFVRLGGCDLILFSAGIGENSPYFRKKILEKCQDALGIRIDEDANAAKVQGKEGLISSPDSRIRVVVIPTDEEVMIARDIVSILKL